MDSSSVDTPSNKDEKQLEEMETDEETIASGVYFVIPSFKRWLNFSQEIT